MRIRPNLETFLAVLSVCLGSATAARADVFITFDTNASGNTINAPIFFKNANPLTDLYSPLGVTFAGPSAIDGGAILNEGSNFGFNAHSGVNFLAFNRAAQAIMMNGGMPIDPETITFNQSYQTVSIFAAVGIIDEDEDTKGTFTMTAYSSGVQVGSTMLSLLNKDGFQELSVSSAGGIDKVVLTETGSPLFAYDDLRLKAVPEPASFFLLFVGLSGAAFAKRLRGL